MKSPNKRVIELLVNHIKHAYEKLDRKRFRQEPAYITALMGRLDGDVFNDGKGNSLTLKTTIVDDRGANSAESRTGADFSIVLEKQNCKKPISKAILGQGKNGSIEKLSKAEQDRLDRQCSDMHQYTTEFVVLEAPEDLGEPPMIRIGDKKDPKHRSKAIKFEDYLIKHFLSCQHGDQRKDFVAYVQDSKLAQLKIITKGLDLELSLNPKHDQNGPSL